MIAEELSKAKILPILTMLIVLVFLPCLSSGQTTVVKGIVQDKQGNPLPDAKITFYDQVRGGKFTIKSNVKGEFIKAIQVSSPPPIYKVSVELEGYFPYEFQYRLRTQLPEEKWIITLEKIPPRIEEDKDYADGINFFQRGQYENAIESFKKSIEKFPDNLKALYTLGLSYLKAGKLDEAIIELNAAGELDPELIEIYLALGECYFRKGESEKALEIFSRALDIQPDNPRAHYNLGIVYYKYDQTEQAIVSFEKSIELDPNFSSAYYQRGLAYVKTGDFAKAIKSFEEFLKLEPDSPEAGMVKEMIEKLKKQINQPLI